MAKFRRILVAVRDLRVRRSAIVERAASIAAGSGARLELFHDLATPIYLDAVAGTGKPVASLTREGTDNARRRLDRLAEPLRARGLKVDVAAAWDFPAYEAVIRRAIAIGADLIVAQKRGHHRMPALLGYTDWELLRASPVPVLLVKQARARPRATVLAAVDPQHAAAGTGALEKRILGNAAALATALRAPLHAVQVLTPWTNPTPAQRNALKGLVYGPALKPPRMHLLLGNPDVLLPKAARHLRAGTIVMGMMSRRGLKRLFIGNSAERLLDDLRCDVLVVKPPHAPVRVPRARRGVYFLTSLPTG